MCIIICLKHENTKYKNKRKMFYKTLSNSSWTPWYLFSLWFNTPENTLVKLGTVMHLSALTILTDQRVSERASEWMSEWASEWMSERASEWMSEWVSEWVSERASEWIGEWAQLNEWVLFQAPFWCFSLSQIGNLRQYPERPISIRVIPQFGDFLRPTKLQ